MTKNMGQIDRLIRTVVAIALIALIVTGHVSGAIAIIAALVAAVFLLTSVVGFCPLYRLIGVSTCARR